MTQSLPSQHFVPVLSNEDELKIQWDTLRTIIGGRSPLDVSELHVATETEARIFLAAYGIDLSQPGDRQTAAEIKEAALAYLTDVLLPYRGVLTVPSRFVDSSLEELFVAASSWPRATWPNWPCVLLKLCHAVAHTRWGYDTEANRAAVKIIRDRTEKYLYKGHGTTWIGDQACAIPLVDYQIKETKRFSRIMTKLLHKPGNLSSAIVDHVGLRFVTYDLFSAILLIRFLRTRGVFMYANGNPQFMRNSLVDFAKIEELFNQYNPDVVLSDSFDSLQPDQLMRAPDNPFSSSEFKMIKLVERLLITLPGGRRTFFPYELQIIDRAAYLQTIEGESHHDAYETRQIEVVRRRVFGRRAVSEA